MRHLTYNTKYGHTAYEHFFWTAGEKQKFADAVREFGDDRKKISEFVGSKSVI